MLTVFICLKFSQTWQWAFKRNFPYIPIKRHWCLFKSKSLCVSACWDWALIKKFRKYKQQKVLQASKLFIKIVENYINQKVYRTSYLYRMTSLLYFWSYFYIKLPCVNEDHKIFSFLFNLAPSLNWAFKRTWVLIRIFFLETGCLFALGA